jgi:hypothetical protein
VALPPELSRLTRLTSLVLHAAAEPLAHLQPQVLARLRSLHLAGAAAALEGRC